MTTVEQFLTAKAALPAGRLSRPRRPVAAVRRPLE